MAEKVTEELLFQGEEHYASDGSEIIHCDPCKFDNIEEDAHGYCYDCNEFLCTTCLQSHRKFRAFRDHNILVGDSIPKQKADTSQRLALKLCDDHRMNEVQFYCTDHKSVFCNLCKTAKHSTCVCKQIPDICQESSHADLEQAVGNIDSIKSNFESLKSSNIEKIDAIKGINQKCKAKINCLRGKMCAIFDVFEEKIDTCETEHDSLVKELRENVEVYSNALNHISSLSEHIKQVMKSSDKTAIFAAQAKLKKTYAEYLIVKESFHFKEPKKVPTQKFDWVLKVEQMCDEIVEKINQIEMNKANQSSRLTKQSKSTLQASTNSSQMSETDTTKNESYSTKTVNSKSTSSKTSEIKEKNFEKLKIKQKFLRQVKTGESSPCNITDMVFLPNRDLVLCDYANSNVFLFDTSLNNTDQLVLENRPSGITVIDANKIIVTCPDQKKLIYVTVDSRKLLQGSSFSMKDECSGITTFKGHLFIACHNNQGDAFIEIRKETGAKIRKISVEGENDLVPPIYVEVNQQDGDVYINVSGGKQTLLRYTLDGKLLSKYQGDQMKQPRQMITDDHGNSLVCSGSNKKLVIVNDKLNAIQDIWQESDLFRTWMKQSRSPQTVAMRWEDLTLVVGHESRNQIQVIKCMM